MIYIRLIAITLFCLCFSLAHSQTEVIVRDLESWSTIGLDKKLNENTSLEIEQSLRLYNNSSQLDQFFSNVALKIRLSESVSIAGGVRYIGDADKDDGEIDNNLRFNGDLNYRHEIERLTFKYRLRFQARNELGLSKAEGDFAVRAIRLKAAARYNIKDWKLDPEFSGEIFRESGKYMLSSFNKYRITISTKYKFNDRMDLRAFYRMEKELGISYPQMTNIVGFKLMFNL